MKLNKAVMAIGVCGILGGAYAWQTFRSPSPAPSAGQDGHADLADPKNKAVAEMAKFLESVPRGQLQAMNVIGRSTQEAPQPWASLLRYTKNTESGVWIAQMLSVGGPLGTDAEARAKLLAEPASSAQEVETVLEALPESMVPERTQLLHFLGTLATQVKDPAPIQASLLKESQKSASSVDSASSMPLPQAIALEEYLEIQHDKAKRIEAYNAALHAQSDPVARAIIQRFDPGAPTSSVAAARPATQEAPQAESARAEPPRSPASESSAPAETSGENSNPPETAPQAAPPAADPVDEREPASAAPPAAQEPESSADH